MEYAIIAFVVLSLLAAVLLKFGRLRRVAVLPYAQSGPLFTPAERSFLGVLRQACGGRYAVMGKVRLADVLRPRRGLSKSAWQSAFNRISARHFDFVLCDPGTLSVACVFELQDRSHNDRKRSARDRFLRDACEAAELPLIEFEARPSYSVAEIRSLIEGIVR